MSKPARILPPVCLSIAIFKLLTGKLRMSQEFVGCESRTKDNQIFTIFRHIKTMKTGFSDGQITFVVSFKFARLSHRANKLASLLPMLLIAGFPGFIQKIYAVHAESGYWQGMYIWRSVSYLDAYKKSFVFRMMNKRALKGTVQSQTISNCPLSDLIEPDLAVKNELL
jgi:hypothetical protein